MSKRKRNTPVCRCAAYPFPHRKDGGKCWEETQQEYQHREGKSPIDEVLDDPRRGQAREINAENQRFRGNY